MNPQGQRAALAPTKQELEEGRVLVKQRARGGACVLQPSDFPKLQALVTPLQDTEQLWVQRNPMQLRVAYKPSKPGGLCFEGAC